MKENPSYGAFRIKDKFMFSGSDNPEGTHWYIRFLDPDSGHYYLKQMNHLFVKDPIRFKQLRQGLGDKVYCEDLFPGADSMLSREKRFGLLDGTKFDDLSSLERVSEGFNLSVKISHR